MMNRVKILVLSWEFPPVIVGGLGKHVERLVDELTTLGHDVVVITRSPVTDPYTAASIVDEHRPASPGSLRVVLVPLTPLALDFTSDLMGWTLLMGTSMMRAIHHLTNGTGPCTALGAWQPDIVHGHDWLVAVPAVEASEQLGIPLVGTFHATEAGRNSGWLSHRINQQIHSAEWWFAHACDQLITCSQAMREEVSEAFGDPASGSPGLPPITVIPNGIDSSQWATPRPESRVSPHPELIYFGRLEWEKGVHDLLSCLPQLRRLYPGIHCTIAGEGVKSDWLRAEQRRHRLQGVVSFAGFLRKGQLTQLLQSADLAVFPSRYEPFGIVALEAAAAGIPMVVANTGGLAEIVENGRTGWSYSPGIIEDMVETIDEALRAPTERDARARLLHSELDTRFAWTTIARNTVEVYEAALSQTNRRAQRDLPRPKIPLRPLPQRDFTTLVDPVTVQPRCI